jgi:hypothetical protein
MFWKLAIESPPADTETLAHDGRFVLHRHHDLAGPHLDLRLESGDCCLGWRIEGTALADAVWAAEKAPHPLRWLEADGDAIREDAGVYTWLERDTDHGRLLLRGQRDARVIRLERGPQLSAAALHAVLDVVRAAEIAPEAVAQTLRDGLTARRRALARLCGLGRELEGEDFDEAVWRKSLAPLSLDEIHRHLHAFEQRFDRKYPPRPLSRPERLDTEADAAKALQILRG